jgi:hypothetical protein
VIAAVTSDPRREETSTAGNMQPFCVGSASCTNPKDWELWLYGMGEGPLPQDRSPQFLNPLENKHSYTVGGHIAHMSGKVLDLCDPRQVISVLGASIFSFIEYT